jgi:exodeoxyribonuclease III
MKKLTNKKRMKSKPQEEEEVEEIIKTTPKKKRRVTKNLIQDDNAMDVDIVDIIEEKPEEAKEIKLPKIPEGKELKIYAWNINGFRAVVRKGSIEAFLSGEDPDFLCLGETKIDQEALEKLDYHKLYQDLGYKSYWNHSRARKGYSGVAIFTKYEPVSVSYGINIDEHDQEGRVVTLEFQNFYLVSVYVPNAGAGCRRLDYRVNEWDVAFQNYLKELKKNKDVIVCGDMNVAHNPIDLKHPKANEGSSCYTIEERNSLTKFFEAGFVDTFRHLYPTTVKYSYFCQRIKSCIDKNVGWRLDYAIINKEALPRLVNSEILNQYRGSDHTPIKMTFKSSKI